MMQMRGNKNNDNSSLKNNEYKLVRVGNRETGIGNRCLKQIEFSKPLQVLIADSRLPIAPHNLLSAVFKKLGSM